MTGYATADATPEVELVLVPYDSGRRGERMGAGPDRLVAMGLRERIERTGARVTSVTLDPPEGAWRAEIRTAFDLAAAVAQRVAAARSAKRFPLVLSGNCFASVGVVAGLGAGTAVLWCDAHGDFNTPETTAGGFLDGMALATATGRCWTGMTAALPGFAPVAEHRVWLAGARDLDPPEAAAVDRSAVHRVAAARVGAPLAAEVCAGLGPSEPLHLHLDLDVLDAAEGHANAYAVAGGASAAGLVALCTALRGRVAAATISAYDPAADGDGRIAGIALAAVEALVAGTRDGVDAPPRPA